MSMNSKTRFIRDFIDISKKAARLPPYTGAGNVLLGLGGMIVANDKSIADARGERKKR